MSFVTKRRNFLQCHRNNERRKGAAQDDGGLWPAVDETAGQYDLSLHNPVFLEGGEVSGGKAEDGSQYFAVMLS